MIDKHIMELARDGAIKVCTYGLGYLGKRLYDEIPRIFGLVPRYFCDGNDQKVDSIKLAGLEGIYKQDLINTNVSYLVFILVDDPYDLEIQKELSANKKLFTLTLREMAQMDEVIKKFYGDQIYAGLLRVGDYRERKVDKR